MAGELMVEEYKWLRSELMRLSGNVSRWQLIGFVSAGLAIVFALVTGGFIIAASALVVIAGCVFGIIHDLASINRINAYIQVFLEGRDTGALWETRLENTQDTMVLPVRSYMTPIISLLSVGMFSALIAGVLPVVFPVTLGRQYWTLAIPIVWLMFWPLVQPSYKAYASNSFRNQARKAFYDSLKRPPKEESGLR
jgi:hypothetical protein